MAAARYDIENGSARLVVRLGGEFDDVMAEQLEKALGEILEKRSGAFHTLVDLCGLEECSVFARTVLVRIQRALAAKSQRTAYLANQSRFRGLGLWICHLAEDPNARAVVTEEAAEAWFQGTQARDPLDRLTRKRLTNGGGH